MSKRVRDESLYRPSLEAARDLRFIVASTGRAGSRWVSALFTRCGYLCSHERVFNPWMETRDWNWVGESAWETVPFLEQVRNENPDILVFHQVRNPIGYITSIMGTGGFEPRIKDGAHEQFQLDRVRPEIELGDPMETAINMWINWNEMARPYADVVYQIEGLYYGLMNTLVGLLGGELTKEEFAVAETQAKDSRNFHPKNHRITLNDIIKSPSYPRLKEVAESYGYSV